MNRKIYLAFDIDGTIYDAGNIIEEAFSNAIRYAVDSGIVSNIENPTKEAITETLGYPLDKITLMLFPQLDESKRYYLSQLWTDNLVSLIKKRKGTLIDGVREAIAEMADEGYGMLVASNGARAYVEAILETYDLKKYFSEPFVYAEGGIKNKTDIVRYYISVFENCKIIMIGDRLTDLDAARINEIPFIGCAFGHAGIDEIAGEKYIVSQFQQIPSIVKTVIRSL